MNTMNPRIPVCRNYGGTEFYSRDVELWGHTSHLLQIGFFSKREVCLRVCGACGLLEWFVSPESLDKVKQKFSREA